jgi:hypothetical protein
VSPKEEEPDATASSTVRGRPLTREDQTWIDLAAELTPARVLDRLNRTDNTVAVVGAAVTGLAVFGAKFPALSALPHALAIAAAVTAALAVTFIIWYQIQVPRAVNMANLSAVKNWYTRQLTRRWMANAGLYLLGLSIFLGIIAGLAAIAAPVAAQPALFISQAPSSTTAGHAKTETLRIRSVFHGLPEGQPATTTVTTHTGQVLASSAVTPTSDGTATNKITISDVHVSAQLTVNATTAGQHCQATLGPDYQGPAITCG